MLPRLSLSNSEENSPLRNQKVVLPKRDRGDNRAHLQKSHEIQRTECIRWRNDGVTRHQTIMDRVCPHV